MTQRERDHADLCRRAVDLAERTAGMTPVQFACYAMSQMSPEAQLEICGVTLLELTGIRDPEEMTLRQGPALTLYDSLRNAVLEREHSYVDMLLLAGVVVLAILTKLREEAP